MEHIAQIIKEIQRYGRVCRERQLAQLGLTLRHGLYFREIHSTPGISQEQLAQKVLVNKSNVARQVAAMEEEGYISRQTCGKDKRVLRLYLTEKAQQLIPAIEAINHAWEERLVEGFTESEQQILRILLLRLRTAAEDAVREGDQ